MTRTHTLAAVVVALASLAACSALAPPTSSNRTPGAAAHSSPSPIQLRVLLTTDEHGWLSPLHDKKNGVWRGGIHAAAAAMRAEGYEKGAPGWMLMSAGDMWTGPFETTVLEGAPMTEAMNHLGYRAVAVGNHEFDFGQGSLAERAHQASFPFLGANLVQEATGQPPPWMKGWTMLDVTVPGGVARVAVVGLACVDSPITADVRHMAGLRFEPYEATLRRVLPEVKAAAPDVIVVLAHDRVDAVRPLVPVLRAYGVSLVAAGHEHRPSAFVDDAGTSAVDDDVVICNAGPYLRSLCRVDLEVERGVLRAHRERIIAVEHPSDAPAPAFDEGLHAIVAEAEASAQRVGGEVLVESRQRLSRGRDGSLGQLLVDAWLEALPFADVALTNAGGLRQDIEPGPLRLRDIISALPFQNTLLVVEVTGRELREVLLANPQTVVGGARYEWSETGEGRWIVQRLVDRDGVAIADDRVFKAVINDFMYRGGDHYTFEDRTPEETAMDWREPVYRLLRTQRAAGKSLDRRADDRAVRR
jgi:5'-nucleotidase/UDP-sugar diphosphatase